MNRLHKTQRLFLAGEVIFTAILLLTLIANSTPLPEMPNILAGSMSKNKTFLRYSLDKPMVDEITKSINMELKDPMDKQLFEESLETAVRKLNAGKTGRVTTTEELAKSLSSKTAHGDLFETLSARSVQGRYTRPNNPGVDYGRYDSTTQRWIFSQAKAYQRAADSAKGAMVDSLEYVGKDPTSRLGHIIRNEHQFEAVIPADQFEELKQAGLISSEGKPSENLIDQTLRIATKNAEGVGDSATRIRAALPSAKEIVSRVIVRPGPVTYPELMKMTSRAQSVLSRMSVALRNPIVNAIGKSAGIAGVVATAPIMFAQLDDLNSRNSNGTVTEEQNDRESFAIYGSGGLSAGVGVALLVFTPAGWVGLAVVGTGALTCWLVDEECFQCLYDKVIQTEQSKQAFIELRKIRGERAAHLSGFSITSDMILNVDERGSYIQAWKNAGSPPIQIPSDKMQHDFEIMDSRLWVENKPTENDVLHFRLESTATQ